MPTITRKQQTTYVALLRGINVGGNCRVEMKKLCDLFLSLGFKHVSTYINSGNVIFTTSKDPKTILKLVYAGLQQAFFAIPVIIRDQKNILNIVKSVPTTWQNDADQKTDVLFLWDEVDTKSTLKEIVQNPEVDKLVYYSGAIVWHVARKVYNKSGMHKFIGTRVYKHMTARNINTVRKLAELMSAK